MAQANLDANQINLTKEENRAYICDLDTCDWYADIIYYLNHMIAPPHMIDSEL